MFVFMYVCVIYVMHTSICIVYLYLTHACTKFCDSWVCWCFKYSGQFRNTYMFMYVNTSV